MTVQYEITLPKAPTITVSVCFRSTEDSRVEMISNHFWQNPFFATVLSFLLEIHSVVSQTHPKKNKSIFN